MTFTLTPKDLFYEHGEYLYFLVVYKDFNVDDADKDTQWILGLQFLQKFTLVFDRNEKLFYYYKINYDDENSGKENKKNKNNNTNNIYIIVIIVLVVVFVACILFLIYYIFKTKPRKIKVNELEEQYEYENKDKGNGYLIN